MCLFNLDSSKFVETRWTVINPHALSSAHLREECAGDRDPLKMIKNLIDKIKGCEGCRRRKGKFYRWLAKSRLIRRYEYLNEVNKILEEYLTDRILGGGSAEFLQKSRQDLISKQGEIKETDRMVSFLKKL